MEPTLQVHRPKRVTTQQLIFTPEVDPNANPGVQPIWGLAVVQLFNGGNPWKPDAEPEILRKPSGAPRKPQPGREVYPGVFTDPEPDPAISSKTKTGQLVRAMWRAGWTVDQAHAALSDPVHDGGAWYRWSAAWAGKDSLADIWKTSPSTETDPYIRGQYVAPLPRSNSSAGGRTITRSQGFRIDEGRAAALYQWLLDHPDLSENQVGLQGPIRPRALRSYLLHLQDQGRVRGSLRRIATRAGLRTARVWEAIVPTTTPAPVPTFVDGDLESLLEIGRHQVQSG